MDGEYPTGRVQFPMSHETPVLIDKWYDPLRERAFFRVMRGGHVVDLNVYT